MAPTLQFLGAARTVTGSRYLLRAAGREALVDCGLFQGLKELRERNWAPMPLAPGTLDGLLLTHAHVDHSGGLPRLVRQGYKGPVYCTPATRELLRLLLPDSGHLQEEQARFANKRGFTKHKPALPLYTAEDGERALLQLEAVDYGRPFTLAPGLEAVFHPTGHILGAAFAELRFEGRRVVFSGDLGGYGHAVMRGPDPLPDGLDAVLVESTYGGRRQDHRPIEDQLADALGPALERSGVVVIPAFAIGRTTIVLYHLRRLQDAGRLPDVPVYVDSPMATDAVLLYCKFGREHNLRADLLESSKDCPIRARTTHLVHRAEDSKALNEVRGPAVIISASGMATAGRVVHHLAQRLPGPDNLVLLVGYQAAGTRGRDLLSGAKSVRIHGEDVPVRAEVKAVNGLSAHGDADDIMRWLGSAKERPKRVFLVHGEDEGLSAMAARVDKELRVPREVPDYLSTYELGSGTK
ncbi:MAG: MBL fold metallo-hydrolase [Elusimicrobia bacterium]|nr:MBL fold metallo-hydrolase [Elusimicrobiota bacterium]